MCSPQSDPAASAFFRFYAHEPPEPLRDGFVPRFHLTPLHATFHSVDRDTREGSCILQCHSVATFVILPGFVVLHRVSTKPLVERGAIVEQDVRSQRMRGDKGGVGQLGLAPRTVDQSCDFGCSQIEHERSRRGALARHGTRRHGALLRQEAVDTTVMAGVFTTARGIATDAQ